MKEGDFFEPQNFCGSNLRLRAKILFTRKKVNNSIYIKSRNSNLKSDRYRNPSAMNCLPNKVKFITKDFI